jgi:Spy/CpxP family protein refolding chaperone
VTRKVLSRPNVARILGGAAALAACVALTGGTAQALRGPGLVRTAAVVEVAPDVSLPFQPPAAATEQTRGVGPGRSGPEGQNVRAWWRDPEIAKEVGLTPAQIAKIDKLYQDRQKRIEPWVAEYKTQNAELNRMMRERTASPEEIEAQARRLMYPSMDIHVSRFRLLYEMGRVMTPEQNAKLRARFDRERRSRDQERTGGRGPDGN